MVSANTTVEFAGTLFEFGNTQIIIPSLSTRQVRENYELLVEIGKEPAGDILDDIELVKGRLDKKLRLIQLAASRNYPEITDEDLLDLIELSDLDSVLVAALGRSMSEKVKTIKIKTGETQPVA